MTLHDEVPRPMQKPDHRALLGRQRDQRLMLDELQVAARRSRHRPARVGHATQELRRPKVPTSSGDAVVARLGVDRAGEIPRDARDHLRKLDRHRDVMDEVDEDGHRET